MTLPTLLAVHAAYLFYSDSPLIRIEGLYATPVERYITLAVFNQKKIQEYDWGIPTNFSKRLRRKSAILTTAVITDHNASLCPSSFLVMASRRSVPRHFMLDGARNGEALGPRCRLTTVVINAIYSCFRDF